MAGKNEQLLITYVSLTKEFINTVVMPVIKIISTTVYEAIISTVGMIMSGVGIVIGIVTLIFSIDSYFSALSEMKKARNLCYGMYRRIKRLLKIDTNKLIYLQIDNLINTAQTNLIDLAYRVKSNDKNVVEMEKKYFVPCDFNSFVLTTNILSWIDTNEQFMTVRNGSIQDYVKFVSIIDYIETHKVIEQDKVRIESFIYDNNVDMLNVFALNLDYLKEQIQIRLDDKTALLDFTVNDLKYLKAKVRDLLSMFGDELLHNLQRENNSISGDVVSLFTSIYRYLDYGYAFKNSFANSYQTLIQTVYPDLDIEEYCKNYPEYPIYLFQNNLVYFGNILYNNTYIKNYEKQIVETVSKNPSVYSKELISQINNMSAIYKDIQSQYVKWTYFLRIYENIESGKNDEYIFNENLLNFYSSIYKNGELINLRQYLNIETKKHIDCTDILNNSTITDTDLQLKSLPKFLFFGQSQNIDYTTENFLKKYIPFEACFGAMSELVNKKVFNGAWWDLVKDELYYCNMPDLNKTYKVSYTYKDSLGRVQTRYITQQYLTDEQKQQITNARASLPSAYKNYCIKKDVIDFINKYPTFDDYLIDILKTKNGFLFSLLALESNFTGGGMTDDEKRVRSCICLPDGFGNDRYNEAKSLGKSYYYNSVMNFNTIRNNLTRSINYSNISFMNDFFNPYKYWYERKQIYDAFYSDFNLIKQRRNDLTASTAQPEINLPEYNAILSQVEVTKDNAYIFNIFKEILSLVRSNLGFVDKMGELAFAHYKYENNVIFFDGYFNVIEFLNTAYDRTGFLEMFYLLNKQSIDKLFSYAQGNFQNKLDMYNYYKEITPDYTDVIIKYEQGIKKIEQNFYNRINGINTDTIYQSMQQELISKEVSENEKILENIENKKYNTSDSKLLKYGTIGILALLFLKNKSK